MTKKLDHFVIFVLIFIIISFTYMLGYRQGQLTTPTYTESMQDATQAGYESAMRYCGRQYIAPMAWECINNITVIPVECEGVNEIYGELYGMGWLP